MSLLLEVALAIFGAVLGAAVSLTVPIVARQVLYKRRRPELAGQWRSTFQRVDQPVGQWVTEDVTLDLHRGEFRLRNRDNRGGFEYVATGRLHEKYLLAGDWRSLRPGAHANGTFVFMINPQGDLLYGYTTYPDPMGAQRYSGWVLAREDDRQEFAKGLLRDSTILDFTPQTAGG